LEEFRKNVRTKVTLLQESIIVTQNSVDYLQAENSSLSTQLQNLLIEQKKHEDLVHQESQLRDVLAAKNSNELDDLQSELNVLQDLVSELNTKKSGLESELAMVQQQMTQNPSQEIENQILQLNEKIAQSSGEYQKVLLLLIRQAKNIVEAKFCFQPNSAIETTQGFPSSRSYFSRTGVD
jgi:chromosome segregation ATPase